VSDEWRVEKEFVDYADDIESVKIHYAWTALGGAPDWDQRVTLYMPLASARAGETGVTRADPGNRGRIRKKVLKLPRQILDPATGELTDRFLLHHYFEVVQGGHRHYSPHYSEEIVTTKARLGVNPRTRPASHTR
jgi:hypothetical protein